MSGCFKISALYLPESGYGLFYCKDEDSPRVRRSIVPRVIGESCLRIFSPFVRSDLLSYRTTLEKWEFPLDCFQDDYEERIARVLSPDLTNHQMAWAMCLYPMLARHNPLSELVSMERPAIREKMDKDIARIMEDLKKCDLPESFVTWPENRADIETYKFPWEQ
jgi:hypothetical protein